MNRIWLSVMCRVGSEPCTPSRFMHLSGVLGSLWTQLSFLLPHTFINSSHPSDIRLCFFNDDEELATQTLRLGWIWELGPGMPSPNTFRGHAGPPAAPRTACDLPFRPRLAQKCISGM